MINGLAILWYNTGYACHSLLSNEEGKLRRRVCFLVDIDVLALEYVFKLNLDCAWGTEQEHQCSAQGEDTEQPALDQDKIRRTWAIPKLACPVKTQLTLCRAAAVRMMCGGHPHSPHLFALFSAVTRDEILLHHDCFTKKYSTGFMTKEEFISESLKVQGGAATFWEEVTSSLCRSPSVLTELM